MILMFDRLRYPCLSSRVDLGISNETAGHSWSRRQEEEDEEEVEDERKNLKKKEINCGWGVSSAGQTYTLPEMGADV